MGRAPCCDKANVKKGPWSPEEDATLKSYIEQHGTGGNWIALPQKIGLKRCGKSCRLRWLNYLRPNIKHGSFSEEEDNIICSLYISIGSRWSIIAAQLPGRTDNDIKNYWNTRLKKKLLGKQRKEQARRAASCIKQDIKRESHDYHINYVSSHGFINQAQYWPPTLPVTMPPPDPNPDHHQHHLKDQASLKSLLIKLGGKFSDDHDHDHYQPNSSNFQYPLDISFTQDLPYENSMNFISNSSSIGPKITCSQFPSVHYNANETSPNMIQGLENLSAELSELIYGNPVQLDGLESFYGMNMVNTTSTGTSSTESTSWGDMSSLMYSSVVSDYEACQQIVSQDSSFEEASYFRPQ